MRKLFCLTLIVCALYPTVVWASGVPAAAGSALTSYINPSGIDHIVFLGSNQHVYQLRYNGSWTTQDLTSLAGAGVAASGSALTTFVDSKGNEHVLYLDPSQHVHQLYYNGTWSDQDLTAETGNTLAASGSHLTSFDDEICGLTGGHGQHVVYLGTNLHVYQLYWNGNWSNQDLTAISGNHLAASGSALTSFDDVPNGGCNEHIFYLDASAHVNQLYYNGGWSNQDLTASTGNHTAAAGSSLTGFEGGDGHNHVFYLSPTPQVHQLYYNGSWADQDLGGSPASGSALTSFDDGQCHGQHAGYLGANAHVYQLYYNGSWNNQDLTAITGNHLAASGSALTSFVENCNEHIVYLDGNGHVNQLYYNGSWTNQDLTALSQ
jgi:hypothetical protein